MSELCQTCFVLKTHIGGCTRQTFSFIEMRESIENVEVTRSLFMKEHKIKNRTCVDNLKEFYGRYNMVRDRKRRRQVVAYNQLRIAIGKTKRIKKRRRSGAIFRVVSEVVFALNLCTFFQDDSVVNGSCCSY